MNRSLLAGALVWGLACTPLAAQTAPDSAERQSIADQRAQAEAAFTAGERECQSRFAVTACVDALRQQKRDMLARLRAREIELDDARRRADAEAARQRREEKQSAAKAPHGPSRNRVWPGDVAASASSRHTPPAEPGHTTNRAAEHGDARRAKPHRDDSAQRSAERADEAAAAAQRAAARQRQAERSERHREQVEQRNAQRAAQGKRAAPLPEPSAASAAQP